MRRRPLLGRAALALACAAGLVAGPVHAQHASDEDVPFITTPDRVTLAMLQLAGVGPADRLVDLGSGDGRIVITAARRFGARGLGVELVPDLVARSLASAAQAGVADRVSFRVQDLFDTDLAGFSVITMYLLPEVNLKLRPRLLALPAGTRIVSHDWDLGDWQPDRTRTVEAPDKPVGLEKRSRLMLWVVPARLQGAWCGSGAHAGTRLQVRQQFQIFDATLSVGNASLLLNGRIEGPRLQAAGGFDALSDGSRLRVRAAGSGPAALTGAEFERCAG